MVQKSINLIILYCILSIIFISLLGWILFTKSKDNQTIGLILFILGAVLMIISNLLLIIYTNINMLLWSVYCGIFGCAFIFASFIYYDSANEFIDNESVKSYGYIGSIILIMCLAITSSMIMDNTKGKSTIADVAPSNSSDQVNEVDSESKTSDNPESTESTESDDS